MAEAIERICTENTDSEFRPNNERTWHETRSWPPRQLSHREAWTRQKTSIQPTKVQLLSDSDISKQTESSPARLRRRHGLNVNINFCRALTPSSSNTFRFGRLRLCRNRCRIVPVYFFSVVPDVPVTDMAGWRRLTRHIRTYGRKEAAGTTPAIVAGIGAAGSRKK